MGISPTALKTFRIIELLSKNPQGLILSEIAGTLHIPVSTVFDILQTLVSEDILVIKDGRLKNYAIGPKLYIYGSTYTRTSNLLNTSKKYLKELAEEYGMTAFVVKRNVDECVSVYKYEAKNAKIITDNLGDPVDLFNTAAGKVYLAFDSNYLQLIENHEFVKFTAYTITDKDKYIEEIENIQKTCIAYDYRENQTYVVSIACPVFDKNSNGNLSGVLSLTGPYTKDIDVDAIGQKLLFASQTIQQILEVTEKVNF